MLDLYKTSHYPGKLIVVEGIDGSGKSTQADLLQKWLSSLGVSVFCTEWNSSPLVKAATKMGKKKNLLTPTIFSLLHATDFAVTGKTHPTYHRRTRGYCGESPQSPSM